MVFVVSFAISDGMPSVIRLCGTWRWPDKASDIRGWECGFNSQKFIALGTRVVYSGARWTNFVGLPSEQRQAMAKLKLSLCLTKRCYEEVLGVDIYISCFLALGTSCRRVVNFKSGPLYRRRKRPCYRVDKKMGRAWRRDKSCLYRDSTSEPSTVQTAANREEWKLKWK
jgi:hypothetical protein